MAHLIFIEEGIYPAEEAFLLNPGALGTVLDDAVMEVYQDGNNERRVRGRGLALNLSIVELLEDHDDIDILIDLGGQFKYLLKTPILKAGKVFSPDVKSLVHFVARTPLEKLNEVEFAGMREQLSLVDRQ
jgi:hypothetical protein